MLLLLGILLLLIDSIGIAYFPTTLLPRLFGRLAFPIFAYLLADQAKNTSRLHSLINRMLLLAVISQFPYLYFRPDVDFSSMSFSEAFLKSYLPGIRPIPKLNLLILPGVSGSPGLNLGFTFTLSLVAVAFLQHARTHGRNLKKSLPSFVMIFLILLTAFFVRVELGAYAVAMVLIFYNSPIDEKGLTAKLFMILPLLTNLFSMLIQSLTMLSIPLIRATKNLYPKLIPSWTFYFFYPLHFLLLGILLRHFSQ